MDLGQQSDGSVFLNPHQCNFNYHFPLNIPENYLSRFPMTSTLWNSMVNSNSLSDVIEHSVVPSVLWTPRLPTFPSLSSALPSQSPSLDPSDRPDSSMWSVSGQAWDLCSQLVSQLPLLLLLRRLCHCGPNDLVAHVTPLLCQNPARSPHCSKVKRLSPETS